MEVLTPTQVCVSYLLHHESKVELSLEYTFSQFVCVVLY